MKPDRGAVKKNVMVGLAAARLMMKILTIDKMVDLHEVNCNELFP